MNGRALTLTFALSAGAAALLPLGRPAAAQQSNASRRWEWFYQQRAFPNATIPMGALSNARSQLTSMRARQTMLRISADAAPPPIAGTKWDPLGPNLIGLRDIGRISVIAVHPTNQNILYIGGAQGGVWKSLDRGATWTALTDKQCSLAMGSIAIDPVNPEIVYAATGEQHFSGDSYYGCGVLRSTNGGATWTQLGATEFMGTSHVSRISRIVIVPTGAGTQATTTLFASSDNGIWKSTNGGATWTQARFGYHTDVVVADAAGQTVYAAQYQGGVYRSDNGGSTWSALGTGFATDSIGRINIALVKSQSNTLLASVANLQSSALRGIYKSTDAGATWTKLAASGATCAPQCWYDMFIAVHPTDANIVYFGGVSMFKSFDGGTTFSTAANGLHSDQHFLTFDPQDATRIYLTSDGGVFKSDDAAVSWQSLNAGLGVTQFYPGIALHPTDPATILAGTQDNGTLLTTGSLNWTASFGADGGWAAIDYENPNIRYLETQWTANTTFGGPYRTDNGVGYTRKVNGIFTSDNGLFIPPLVMDPTDPKVLYFGTTKLYRTADRAENWAAIGPTITGAVSTIAPAPSNPSMLYFGTSSGQVHVTTNLSTWTLSTSGLPTRAITDIAVDRTDANTAYVTVSGFGTNHVFRTVNGGGAWTNVSGNLPDMPVNAVALDPVSRGVVMVGTDLGVFISADSGTTWTVIDDGFPNVAVFDIAYNANTGALIAATHGRGMFKLQLNRPLTLAATPLKRCNDVVEGSTTVITDSAAVILSGTDAGTSGWTASHTAAATWLTITTASGTGSGRVRWSRNPTGLSQGLRVDTITITVAGAIDSPLRVIDTLFVCPATPTMTVGASKRGATLNAGVVFGALDSAAVQFSCGVSGVAWSATARKNTYLTFTTPNGSGGGFVRWARKADTLKAGTYYDTVDVASPSATGNPSIADSLIVKLAPLFGTFRSDTLVSGSATPRNAAAALTILGDPGAAAWTVSHSPTATWNSLTTTAGSGNGPIQWTKTSANLANGVYYDTITVSVAGAPPQQLLDQLIVTAPTVVRSCAVSHYFGTACLDATQAKYMDLTGNKDGTFNLGDFLAYLARTPVVPGAPPAVRGGKP